MVKLLHRFGLGYLGLTQNMNESHPMHPLRFASPALKQCIWRPSGPFAVSPKFNLHWMKFRRCLCEIYFRLR